MPMEFYLTLFEATVAVVVDDYVAVVVNGVAVALLIIVHPIYIVVANKCSSGGPKG